MSLLQTIGNGLTDAKSWNWLTEDTADALEDGWNGFVDYHELALAGICSPITLLLSTYLWGAFDKNIGAVEPARAIFVLGCATLATLSSLQLMDIDVGFLENDFLNILMLALSVSAMIGAIIPLFQERIMNSIPAIGCDTNSTQNYLSKPTIFSIPPRTQTPTVDPLLQGQPSHQGADNGAGVGNDSQDPNALQNTPGTAERDITPEPEDDGNADPSGEMMPLQYQTNKRPQ